MCHGHQVATAVVQTCIGCRGRRAQNHDIDDRWQCRDAGALNCNDPRRTGRARSAGRQCRQQMGIVVRNQNSYGERSEHIEQKQPPENSANGFWEIPPWVLCFAGGDDDGLHASIGQRAINETEEKPQEPSFGSLRHKRIHGSRILPISKSDTIMMWTAA